MSNWRRQNPRNNYYQQRTQSPKPPLGNCKQSVPAWEKEFCAVIGAVPWWKVVEAKRFPSSMYGRVLKWDDSAVEEAFKNAKSRFYAEIKGLACDLALPDPDAYIDEVDWEAKVDRELMLDLERRDPEPVRGEEDGPVVILDPLILSPHLGGLGYGTGWGEAEGINEKPKDPWEDQQCVGWNDDSWGIKEKTESWDRKNNNNGYRTDSWDRRNNYNGYYGRDQGRENREWRRRGEAPRGRDRVEDCRWRNGRGRNRGGVQHHSNGGGWTETF